MSIDYDASLEALVHPGLRATVFAASAPPSPLGLAVEAARLAYVQAESGLAERARLDDALDRAGYGPASCLFDMKTGAYAYCAQHRQSGAALVAFRGTEPKDLRDFMTNLQVVPTRWNGVLVHTGFLGAALALEGPVRDWLAQHHGAGQELLLCGHSLGAALATILARTLAPTRVVTIGSPRVGDADFVQALPPGVLTRVVNCADLVTTLPPSLAIYHHAGNLLYIDKDGATHAEPGVAFVLQDQVQGQAEYAWRHLSSGRFGALPARTLADHSPINYVRAFFPA